MDMVGEGCVVVRVTVSVSGCLSRSVLGGARASPLACTGACRGRIVAKTVLGPRLWLVCARVEVWSSPICRRSRCVGCLTLAVVVKSSATIGQSVTKGQMLTASGKRERKAAEEVCVLFVCFAGVHLPDGLANVLLDLLPLPSPFAS